mmetsp:Transcript_45233/g.115748  ORF Transcript_45233/g.115748 Transcript_45233/m.115748 type:complete len:260 (-) Transcript_45233:23-802(-)
MVGRILRRGWRRRRARLAHPARRLEQAGRAHHHQGRPVHEVRRVPDGRVAANVHHVDVVAHGGALVGPERQRGHGGVKAVVWAADNGEVEAAFGELDARVGRDHVKLASPGHDGTGHKVRADGHAARGREWNVASGAGGALVARRRGLEPLEKVWRARGAVKHACYLRGGRVAAVLAATPSAHGGGGLAGHRARHVLLLLLLLPGHGRLELPLQRLQHVVAVMLLGRRRLVLRLLLLLRTAAGEKLRQQRVEVVAAVAA